MYLTQEIYILTHISQILAIIRMKGINSLILLPLSFKFLIS